MLREFHSPELLGRHLAEPFVGTRLPVDPILVAKRFKIKVASTPLDSNISGALIKEEGEDPVIALNMDDSTRQMRWACARQLGYYFFESRASEDAYGFIDYRSCNGGDAEVFAKALLVPNYIRLDLASDLDIPQEKLQ